MACRDNLWRFRCDKNIVLLVASTRLAGPVLADSADLDMIDDLSEMDAVRTGLEGSKQRQGFGANAILGGRAEINWSVPVYEPLGFALQLGTATIASDNAVRDFELIGEKTDILAPQSRNFAIYGETNLMMPADTGTVDAFMALA